MMTESDNVVKVYMLNDLEKENKSLREWINKQQVVMSILFGEAVSRGADPKTLLALSEEVIIR